MRIRTAAIVLLIALSSCTSDDAPPQSEGGTVRVQVSGEQEEIAVYEAMIEAFRKEHPDVDIRLVPVADKDDHLTRLTTAFAAGDPPDVFLVNFREYSQFVTRGAIEPIGSHVDEAGISLVDYYEQPIEAFTYDDALQCMPQNVSSLVVYYNRALFREAGIEHPPSTWAWDDFRSAALALTTKDVSGLGIEPNVIRLAPFVWSNGGELVDDLESPTRFTLDEPEAREAFEFIVSLVRDDRVVPTEEEVAAEDLETRFITGKLGMLLSSRRDTPAFREVVGLDWDVASLPVGQEPAGILHSDGYCIAAESEHLEDAVSFVAFATGEQGETITALGGRTVPSLISVANSAAFNDPTQPPRHSQVFIEGIPFIRRTPVLPTWPEIEAIGEEILTRAFYEDGYTIERALRDLDEQTRPLFEEGNSS